KRLRGLYGEDEVGLVAKELKAAREAIARGLADESYAAAIHERFTYRMHDLGEFMKTLLARFTRWFNGGHQRTGALWESRFKSVLVEEGIASRTMAAYIDLNPVRAGMVEDPALYRWSSYGEAMGGGAKGNGAKARGGLVRAIMAHKGYAADARHWKGAVSKEYRMILLEEGIEKLREEVDADGKLQVKVVRKGMSREVAEEEKKRLERRRDLLMRQMLRYRVRYFSDGVAIGSRGFVDGVFKACRERFSARRTSGARRMRGAGAAAAGVIWSARDLKVGVG
ncbi:MAG: hypothetical protein K9N23_20005, partial [Akkermansiaceae bacterium]|nr:hypothetical protein [Akkermansiaceae bacterium]